MPHNILKYLNIFRDYISKTNIISVFIITKLYFCSTQIVSNFTKINHLINAARLKQTNKKKSSPNKITEYLIT